LQIRSPIPEEQQSTNSFEYPKRKLMPRRATCPILNSFAPDTGSTSSRQKRQRAKDSESDPDSDINDLSDLNENVLNLTLSPRKDYTKNVKVYSRGRIFVGTTTNRFLSQKKLIM
jgi:hypothetical protein